MARKKSSDEQPQRKHRDVSAGRIMWTPYSKEEVEGEFAKLLRELYPQLAEAVEHYWQTGEEPMEWPITDEQERVERVLQVSHHLAAARAISSHCPHEARQHLIDAFWRAFEFGAWLGVHHLVKFKGVPNASS